MTSSFKTVEKYLGDWVCSDCNSRITMVSRCDYLLLLDGGQVVGGEDYIYSCIYCRSELDEAEARMAMIENGKKDEEVEDD